MYTRFVDRKYRTQAPIIQERKYTFMSILEWLYTWAYTYWYRPSNNLFKEREPSGVYPQEKDTDGTSHWDKQDGVWLNLAFSERAINNVAISESTGKFNDRSSAVSRQKLRVHAYEMAHMRWYIYTRVCMARLSGILWSVPVVFRSFKRYVRSRNSCPPGVFSLPGLAVARSRAGSGMRSH